jgi:hypothetical protein
MQRPIIFSDLWRSGQRLFDAGPARFCGRLYSIDALPGDSTCARAYQRILHVINESYLR